MSRKSRASKLGNKSKKQSKKGPEEELTAVDMAGLAPMEIKQGMLGTLLKSEQSKVPEVKLTIDIKEFKLGNKKVAASEVITIHKGNKTTLKVPFNKPLDFSFASVDNNMVFKFAVTGSGDLLGFIYLEIPKKFKTMKFFKLDDWFPIKQIKPDEDDEIVRVQNFVARMVIKYKASRKLKILEVLDQDVPKPKLYQMMAIDLKKRLKNINKDMRNFNEEGFKYLHDFEKKILQRRMDLKRIHRSPVRHKNLKAKEYLNQQKQVFIKGKNVATKYERVKQADTRFTDYYNKEGGKYKLKRGVNTRRAIEELMKELTLTKKELTEKNTKLRALEEGQMDPQNLDLKRQIEQMKDDLQKDKKDLTMKLVVASKELENDRKEKKLEHDKEMDECRDLKNEIDKVMDSYKKKYRELQKLENALKMKTDDNDKLSEKVRLREAAVGKERNRLDNDKQTLDELEEELDALRDKMMRERHNIHKKSKRFGDDRGEIGLRERQLRTQEEFLRNQREDFEREKDKAYKELALMTREIDELKKLGGLDQTQLDTLKDEYEERLAEVERDKKANKREGVKLWREKSQLEEKVKEFLDLKKIADQEKAANQRSLEDDYDFIDGQMSEMENRKAELDELKKHLENFELELGEQENNNKLEVLDFNQNKASFFNAVQNSSFDPKELMQIARDHGIDPEVARKAAENQREQDKVLENKKRIVRASVMGLANTGMDRNTISNRRQTAKQRRTTMVNRMSMAGTDLTAMRDNEDFGPKRDVKKFLEGLFNQSCAKYIKDGKKTLDQQYQLLKGQLDGVNDEVKGAKLELSKSKLAFFLKNVLAVLAEQREKREAEEDEREREEEERRKREELKAKRKREQEEKERLKEMTRKQAIRFKQEKKKREEAERKRKALEEKERKRRKAEKLRKREEAKKNGGGGLLGMLAGGKGKKGPEDMKKDLIRVCEATISQLENELGNTDDKQKVQERIDFLKGAMKCIDNIFGITVFMDKNKKDKIDDAFLRKMELENPDFDFETIRKKYESKIIALVEYIKQIRSNYNFFNPNVDRNILIN
jgi:hypothetical protein